MPFELSRQTPAVLTSDKGTFALGHRNTTDEEWRIVRGSVVAVPQGTRLGFRPVDGKVEAVVGNGTFPLREVPATATEVAWLRVYDLPESEEVDGEAREETGLPDFD